MPFCNIPKKKKNPIFITVSLSQKERKKARKTLFFTENYVGSLVFSFFSFFVLVRVFTEKTGTQRTFLSLPLFSFFVYYLFLSFLFHHQAFIFIVKLSAFSSLSPLSFYSCSSFCFWACGLFLFCISVIWSWWWKKRWKVLLHLLRLLQLQLVLFMTIQGLGSGTRVSSRTMKSC